MNTFQIKWLWALGLCATSVFAWGPPEIEVMTQNQYIGADISPIAAAPDPIALNKAVVEALTQVAANVTKERMEALAAQISRRRPVVVGLQEVVRIQCLDPFRTGACTDPSIAGAFVDQLAATLDALRGAYREAATVVNFKLPFPGLPFDLYGSGTPAFVMLMDRDVILSRRDIRTVPVDYHCTKPSADGCNYVATLPVVTPFGETSFERGYVGVDAWLAGKPYRFVTTHLEVKDVPIPADIQSFQATELITTLTATTPADRSLIVVGDINSSPEDPVAAGIVPPYTQFIEAGYSDAWTLRPGNAPGFTCCQAENLANRKSLLSQRIDVIFSREVPERVAQTRVLIGRKVSVDDHPLEAKLWPSDHGSVAAVLGFR